MRPQDFDARACHEFLATLSQASPADVAAGGSLRATDAAWDGAEAWRILRHSSDDIEMLPKVCCCGLNSMMTSSEIAVTVDACRVVLFACSLPAASATGCKTFSVLNVLLNFICKQIHGLMTSVEDGKFPAPSDAREGNEGEEDDDQYSEPIGSKRGRGLSRQSRSSNQFSSTEASSLLGTVCDTVDMWADVTDDHLLNTAAELLWFSIYTCSALNDLKKVHPRVEATMRKFVALSAHAMMATHRSLVPMLSLNALHNSNIPAKVKSSKVFHGALSRAYVAMIPVFMPLISLEMANARGSFRSIGSPGTASSPASLSPFMDTNDSELGAAAKIDDLPLSVVVVVALVQRIVLSCPNDKQNVKTLMAETTCHIVDSIASILAGTGSLEAKEHVTHSLKSILKFVSRLLSSNKVAQRSISLDIMSHLLSLDFFWQHPDRFDTQLLFVRFVERCEDHNAVVRYKALSVLQVLFAKAAAANAPHNMKAMLGEFACGVVLVKGKAMFDLLKVLLQTETKATVKVKALQIYSLALSTSALSTYAGARPLEVSAEDVQIFASLCQHDALPSAGKTSVTTNNISLRKQALQGLLDLLLMKSDSEEVLSTFIGVALPLVNDCEASIVAKAVTCFSILIFDSICDWYHASLEEKRRRVLGWSVIDKIGVMGLNPLFRTLLLHMLKAQKFSLQGSGAGSLAELLVVVKAGCDWEENRMVSASAWTLLDSIVAHCQFKVTVDMTNVPLSHFLTRGGAISFVLNHYKRKHPNGGASCVLDGDDVRILNILKLVPDVLAKSDAEFMLLRVDSHLQSVLLFSNPEAVGTLMQLRFNLTKLCFGREQWPERCAQWCGRLLQDIYCALHGYVFMQLPASACYLGDREVALLSSYMGDSLADDTELLCFVTSCLTMLGEVSMLGFRLDEVDVHKYRSKHTVEIDGVQYCHSEGDGFYKVLCGQNVVSLVMVLMSETLPSTRSSQVKRVPVKLRAMAFICFGKLCLRDYHLSRDNINIFVREVGPAGSSVASAGDVSAILSNSVNASDMSMSVDEAESVRNNALLILGDLCIKYTHLVDKHIDTLASCLQDRSPNIRRHALLMLTQLLSQEFIKLKGLLFYRFLLLINDRDPQIQSFSIELLQQTLRIKYPSVFQNHFVDLFIILNGCSEHPMYNLLQNPAATEDSAEKAGFDDSTMQFFAGARLNLSRPMRFNIYGFMCQNISEETKITFTAKLVQDVLSVAVDGYQDLLLDRSHAAPSSALKSGRASSNILTSFEVVLEDVLLFLQSPLLKIGLKASAAATGDDDFGEELAEGNRGSMPNSAALAAAKDKVLKTITSQHLISHTLPVVISLKHILESIKSPLQGVLMDFLIHLLKHNRQEVEQSLSMDPTLRAELEYDLKQYERLKEQQQQQQLRLQRSASGAPGSAMRRSARKPGTETPGREASILLDAFIDPHTLPPSSVKRPVLRAGVTTSARSVQGTRSTAIEDVAAAEEDPMLRLTSEYAMPPPTAHSQSRRRSWGVVVSSILTSDENNGLDHPLKVPPAKRRKSGTDPASATNILVTALATPGEPTSTPSDPITAVPAGAQNRLGQRRGQVGNSLLFR